MTEWSRRATSTRTSDLRLDCCTARRASPGGLSIHGETWGRTTIAVTPRKVSFHGTNKETHDTGEAQHSRLAMQPMH